MADTPENGMSTKELVLLLHTKVDKVLDDHEGRIRLLERWKWGMPVTVTTSIAAVVAALLGSR